MMKHSNSDYRDLRERITRSVRGAARLRERLFGPLGRERFTSAYRLIHAEGDELPGFAVDAYGGFLVLQVLAEEALPRAALLEEVLDTELRPRGIVRKSRYLQRGRGRVPELLARGEKPPGILTVVEEGLPMEVELMGGLHTGLFTDMREEHVRMRELASGRNVLNTFAYTGAFSVAAGIGGASQVTSVDVVGKVLERAKRNFRLAGLEPADHHFARMDAREFLGMAKRRAWSFDAVVLDPPTFASFKSGTWSLKKDYQGTIELALSVLDAGGLLWVAANTESLSPSWLEGVIGSALTACRRTARTLAVSGLPPDYPTPASCPEARYLKVHVLEV